MVAQLHSGARGLPVFEHAVEVYRLIGALYQRPRFGDRPRTLHTTDFTWGAPVDEDRLSPKRGLPMLCLICSDGPADLLGKIDGLLDEAKRTGGGLRHVRLDLTGKSVSTEARAPGAVAPRADGSGWNAGEVLQVRELLRQARNGLLKSPKARGSLLRFPRFSLVHQLMGELSDPDDPSPDGTSARMLRERSAMSRIGDAVRIVDKELPESASRWRIPLWLVYLLTLGVFRIAVTGRVPLLSGRYRWFMRQPYLAPKLLGSFVRFAERLVEWRQEAPEHVARLLVNAFLEDLRQAYRLRPWHLFRRRRMTYPMLLLDNITAANGGYLLLRLVNDIRNQVGLFDPLLLITTSAEVPPEAPSFLHPPATKAGNGYVAWQNDLQEERLAQQKSTWYLTIRIHDPATTPPKVAETTAEELRSFRGFDAGRKASRPAPIASLWLRIPLVVVVLATAAGFSLVTWHNQCGSWSSSLTWTGSECIGYTDGAYDLFQPSDATTESVVHTIRQQNQKAAQLHVAFPQRPYVTIADLEAATSTNGTAEGLTTEREGLEGVAIAQSRQLNKAGNSDPIVRVLIVNGGQNMRQGPTVAQQLGALAARDPSLVGVVGLDDSSKQTLDTIDALGAAGLPVVSARLSEDDLATDHPLYFQVAPQNRTEAAVAAAFASTLTNAPTPRSVRIYYSTDADDTYSTNLRDDAERAFTSLGFQVQPSRAFTPTGPPVQHSVPATGGIQLIHDPHSAGQDTCGYNGIVFFAGRGVSDFGGFLDGATQCRSKAVLLADDDVSRYVADTTARESTLALPYYYLSFAFTPPVNALRGLQLDFYRDLNDLFRFEYDRNTNRSLDGHAALSFDATNVLITAVSYLRSGGQEIPITPAGVWREITDIHGSQVQNRLIEGVTGTIDYGGDITRQVPLDKPVAILQVQKGEVNPNIIGLCGTADGFTPSTWCRPHTNPER